MPSASLDTLNTGLVEVATLLRADPTPRGGISPNPDLTRAVTRGCVVILYSHFERYFRAVNEEATTLLNQHAVSSAVIPPAFRLEHSRLTIDDLADTNWDHRETKLQEFVSSEAWLWGNTPRGELSHEKVVTWLRSPDPKSISRFYRLWGVSDILASITRQGRTRQHFSLKIGEFTNKRHNIAHGDFSTEATRREVREYAEVVGTFCSRVDRQMARQLRRSFAIPCTWY